MTKSSTYGEVIKKNYKQMFIFPYKILLCVYLPESSYCILFEMNSISQFASNNTLKKSFIQQLIMKHVLQINPQKLVTQYK